MICLLSFRPWIIYWYFHQPGCKWCCLLGQWKQSSRFRFPLYLTVCWSLSFFADGLFIKGSASLPSVIFSLLKNDKAKNYFILMQLPVFNGPHYIMVIRLAELKKPVLYAGLYFLPPSRNIFRNGRRFGFLSHCRCNIFCISLHTKLFCAGTLPVHQAAADETFLLNRLLFPRLPGCRLYSQHFQYAVMITPSATPVKAVTVQVIHPVYIQLTGYKLTKGISLDIDWWKWQWLSAGCPLNSLFSCSISSSDSVSWWTSFISSCSSAWE